MSEKADIEPRNFAEFARLQSAAPTYLLIPICIIIKCRNVYTYFMGLNIVSAKTIKVGPRDIILKDSFFSSCFLNHEYVIHELWHEKK